ncbi:CRISPR-associated protein, Cas1 family [Aminomonas paucivorans DSM 12260]|uniref:CRISPR-associated endonuclease Cas1 n=1 Tax=Aminomonas paucivorans DSM 12260 TaxID=584708 RepID=E3CY60_9BACT|nr:type I-B CRISPR-associated endonuclease Cas1b [Aminomonas paucivorans]EFQ22708.1 CRISPR-associated protein, Cas1 family [Aminomonas paucivorans DSM 12260]
MGRTLYLLSSGELKRKDNTIVVEGDAGRRFVPVETTDEILVFGEVTLNKRFLEFATQTQLILHFFNHHGYYQGSYYPREHLNAGAVIVAQVKAYLDDSARLDLAGRFVRGALANMEKVLVYYGNRKEDPVQKQTLQNSLAAVQRFRENLNDAGDVGQVMAFEGNAREAYYGAFDAIVEDDRFLFESRTRRPPGNRMNALISFCNTLCYVSVLSQIYRTHLDPRIAYLHETNFRRFSLNLDLSEIFKPLLVDRVIFSLLNRRALQVKHFSETGNGVFLTEGGREIVLKTWEERLQGTIDHPTLNRKVSYRTLLRMEAYKLEKHILGDQPYEAFASRW